MLGPKKEREIVKVEVHLILQYDNSRRRKHVSLLTTYLYSEEELKWFREGIHRALNNVLQSRT